LPSFWIKTGNDHLIANLVTLVQAERWNGVLSTTMVPGSAVSFVSVK
jgi:hypothetical protein